MGLRKIEAVELFGEVAPWRPTGRDDDGQDQPTVEWGDPSTLYVDEDYQRSIGPKGLALIRRVATGGWSWRKFKLPVVTITPTGEYVVIDGQHTATMAVSRGIKLIPWLLVKTNGVADQADAFVGQNADRTAVSTLQQHKALVAAGNEEAMTIERVCERAGVTLCHTQKPTWKHNETIALASIRGLVNRRYAAGAGRVMRILAAAQLAPISADHIKAVETLLFGAEFKDAVKEERITEALTGAAGFKLLDEARLFAARHRTRVWEGLVSVLYKAATGRRAA